ncbi:GntR family transcriptional regulator [Pelagibacterium luteolum]|uniref:DNA-binding transcriptional regulator, GntR family n=1 Tax=Pelagibacterium luteolum TaxID=440168 RepID=A0A1G7WQ76_9HYPH|nr:GntR family transcriptional regulator [Pelagibacterium luteolum]SDG74145.1 DNA-binding transcriptional regulator, GntR family [Pelagibacterium luteolum]
MDTGQDTYAFLSPDPSIQRGSLAAHVTDQLRTAIMTSRLEPGTMLNKSEICTRLGVSRAPVAEAFARLQAEGFVDILPQRGTTVTFLSVRDVEELVFIRKGLECHAVWLLAQRATPDLLDALDENIAAQRDTANKDERDRFHDLDSAFHDMLISSLSFRRIRAMVESVRNNLSRARQMTNTPQRIAMGIDEHADMVDALRARDGNRAAWVMAQHLEGIITEVARLSRERPELFNDDITIHDSGTIRRALSS